MNHYCTLFDSNYLTRGLAMYDSLVNTGEDFVLYIFCFDTLTHEILLKLNLPHIVLITLEEFETDSLKQVKGERSQGEYCWTCTPFTIRYVIDNFSSEEVTYLDADIFFFNKPSILLEEFHKTNNSVMITEHRYTPEYDQTETSGIYCVQFVTFKADPQGMQVLQWWQDRCQEWCYARCEDGKFGDQKYLDNWPVQFQGVHVLQHLGGGVAPWNIQQYEISKGPKVNNVPIVFYHFHQLKWFFDSSFDLGSYRLPKEAILLIYKPYISSLKEQFKNVGAVEPGFNKGKISHSVDWKNLLLNLYRRLKGTYNVIQR